MLQDIKQKLDASRVELLDLSLRNPFLNYKPLKSKGFDIINEISEEVYRILVKEEKALTFDPIKKDQVQQNDELNEDSPIELSAPQSPECYTDLKLQVPVPEKELQIRQLNTYYAARTFIEEQGVNNLFLALGMLKWRDSEDSEKELSAPIVLIPVELIRTNAKEMFRIKYTGEEIQENLSLITKLSNDFSIQFPSFNEIEEFDIGLYFNKVSTSIQRISSWRLEPNAMCIGFFSFGKYLMYKDLDISIWPENLRPDQHPIMSALLATGFKEPTDRISDQEFTDKFVTPQKTNHVMDADSTQILALSDVQAGLNLIIQGPPGTGKSQTITNIIADAMDADKKVLFISEKMAALEVVKRRLDQIGLGDACLELHSQKTNKKSILAELKRVYELGEPKMKDIDSEKRLLLESRDTLNEYSEAINQSIGDSRLTPIQVYGILMSLKRENADIKFPDISTEDMPQWSKDDYIRKEAVVSDLNAHLKKMGTPSNHPFWGSMRKTYLPTEESKLSELLAEALNYLEVLIQKSGETAGLLTFNEPKTVIDIEKLINSLQYLSVMPDLQAIKINYPLWKTDKESIKKSIEAGLKNIELKSRNQNLIRPESWAQDVLEIRQTLNIYRSKWWRFLSGKYRSSKNRLLSLCQSTLPSEYDAWISLCDSILDYQKNALIMQENTNTLQTLLGMHFKGVDTPYNTLSVKTDWIFSIYEALEKDTIPKDFITALERIQLDKNALHPEALKEILDKYTYSFNAVLKALEINDILFSPQTCGWRGVTVADQNRILQQWKNNLPRIQEIVVYNHFTDTLMIEGLENLYHYTIEIDVTGPSLNHILKYNWCEKLLERAFKERQSLAQFARDKHESVLSRFKELDQLLIVHNHIRLAHKHWSQIPKGSADSGQLGVLTWEFQKKSRHLPIRQLMMKAGHAIQAIKPIFMMSPISVANFLTPDTLPFDLIIFDEASQVKPVEAFGSILRGKQVVVVGDSKQMPPTSFFDQLITPDSETDEYSTADVESILALFEAQNAPQRMLRWHYRSRHESLIAVSNYEFYDNKLVVFPSPQKSDTQVGLVYNHIAESDYDKGNTRVNLQEAKFIAQRVMEHAKDHPDLSLGVAALSIPQKQAILDELELLRRKDLSCESFFNSHPNEPFFVKNLENVQGDERDAIFISIGYGKTKEGYLSMNFGPLNNNGGERRLNVLISRARLKCEVFTNLMPEDIDLTRSSARGVQALKTFLTYARNGHLDIPFETGKEEDSPFEQEVYLSLTKLGYIAKKQIGCAGFFIDLAIVDPENSNRYILGIECDGASYHSARSARDRDRLRQYVLENKGWNIHRIWSTDWFRNQDHELKKLVEAIEQAKIPNKNNISFETEPKKVSRQIDRKNQSTVNTNDDKLHNEYVAASLPFINENEIYTPSTLTQHIEKVVEVESPIHVSEVAKRILSFSKLTRTGSAIQKCMDEACEIAITKGKIKRNGDFLWSNTMEVPNVRDRSALPTQSRKIDLITEEEISRAITEVVKESYGLDRDEVASIACQKLGFSRINDELKATLDELITKMLGNNQLKQNGNHIFVKEP